MNNGTPKNDSIVGTDFSDSIDGFLGNDTIQGGGGNDTIAGGAGNDLLFPFKDYDDSNFNEQWLVLYGNDVDYLLGGLGNDYYVMDSWVVGLMGEVIITENKNEGTDTIIGSVSKSRPTYSIPANVENYINDTTITDNGIPVYVVITGNDNNNLIQTSPSNWNSIDKLTAAINETHVSFENFIGGGGNDTLKSGAGNDILDGGVGNDQLFAGIGDDTLTGGAGNDNLDGGTGVDTANFSEATADISVNLTKGSAFSTRGMDVAGIGVDKLKSIEIIVAGDYNDALIGSADVNSIVGGLGNDTLDGGLGNDTLIGGDGADTFIFSTKFSVKNIDVIDFEVGVDKIQLSRKIFTKLKGATDFLAFGTASDSPSKFVIYDAATGVLSYDADGNGTRAQPIGIAVIGSSLDITAADITIIS